MVQQADTIPGMGNKTPVQAKQRNKHVIYATVPRELREAFEAYISATRPRPDRSAVVEAALEDFLRVHGFWPSKK